MVDGMMFGFAMMIWMVLFFGAYLFVAYVFTRVGRKFGVGSYIEFLIPIWNVIRLCDCANVTRWATVAVAAPGLILWPLNKLGMVVTPESLDSAAALITFAGNAYIWGNIAGRLGKSKLLWGILTPFLLFIPAVVLAFGDSRPVDGSRGRYVDV